jgi:CheY-like chemotaxis protein
VVDDPEAAFLCYTICDSATLMLQVITNVMSFMRDGNAAVEEESGLSPKRASFDAQALLDAALQTCDAHERHPPHTVQLEYDPDAPVPPRLEGDTGRLTLILSNAVQWLLRRGFTLTARVRCHRHEAAAADDSGAATLELDLQQRELHLSSEECEAVFSPFAQSLAESEGDTQSGLGMHAARTFARGMGGDLTALCDTPPAEGTVLRLRAPVHVLPFVEPPQPASPVLLQQHKRTASDALGYFPPTPAPSERQRRPRALIVEDHLLNAKLVARLLSRHGFEVSTAGDGAQGLAVLEAALRGGEGAPPLPDVVLADLHMPLMGGVEMVRRFRQAEAAARPGPPQILVMALSANVSDVDVAGCLDAGMDGHISKPLRAELIPVLLQRVRDGGAACGMASTQ